MTDSSSLTPAYRAAADAAVVCPGTGLGVLAIEGDDAPAFLHGQLSTDVNGLAPGRSQWSTYNSPKGRTLATLRLWRSAAAGGPPRFGALVAADLAAPIARRLAMFVLRARARVADESATMSPFGIGGPQAAQAIASAYGALPEPSGAAAMAGDAATIVALGDGRFVVVVAATRAAARRGQLDASVVAADGDVWRWLGVRAGVPLVTAATSERFVPQTLNLDALGGIDIDKGCYTGQEIITRTRSLGQLKERLYGFTADAPPPTAGARIYGPVFGTQACGTVVNAAPGPRGEAAMLAVVQIAAAQSGHLTLDAPNGPPLAAFALPYAVPPPAPARARIRL
jgi:folate-binding protein YgfZ